MDPLFKLFRGVNREHLHTIWQKAQAGDMEGLDEEEQRLAKIMLDHSDEYFNQFEFADVLADREFDPESEVNPFLHITLHAIAEKQVQDRDPIEAFQFYNAMLKNRCTRHEAMHLLGAILIKFMFPVSKERGRFSLDGYRNLLKKYKSRKPEKIFHLLEQEPDPILDKEVDPKSSKIFDDMRTALNDQDFKSIDEAQTFLDDLTAEKNAEPIPEFLGLSPEQMYRVLHRPFTGTTDILTLNRNLLKEDFLDIPVVKETIYFLKRLSELQPLKATAKGNLPQAFAREMHDKFPEHPNFHYPIRSEEQDSKLSALRHLLDMAGWVKKGNQRFSLTQKGQMVVQNGFSIDDFFHLFETYTIKFNWASRDLYLNLEIIQESFLFSCYLLYQKTKTYIQMNELTACFIQAFPAVLNKVERIPFMEPEEEVRGAFYLRFIERFCEYFGLVTIQREKGKSLGFKHAIKITPLFGKMFDWKL
jgi:Domain of unknown function (DUF1841)